MAWEAKILTSSLIYLQLEESWSPMGPLPVRALNILLTSGVPEKLPVHSVFLMHKQIIGTSMGSDKYAGPRVTLT
jgi:hypothetical protein